jgi:hypothetical protein
MVSPYLLRPIRTLAQAVADIERDRKSSRLGRLFEPAPNIEDDEPKDDELSEETNSQ